MGLNRERLERTQAGLPGRVSRSRAGIRDVSVSDFLWGCSREKPVTLRKQQRVEEEMDKDVKRG